MNDDDETATGGGASSTTEFAAGSSSGTDVSLRDYFFALRKADERFDNERDRRYTELAIANDRRLGEVAVEREKALKIKETADLAALSLAREIQDYKDEKANELRTQIERERGTYASKDDLAAAVREINVTIRPLVEYVTAAQARQAQTTEATTNHRGIVGLYVALVAVILTLVTTLAIVIPKLH